MRTDTLNYKYTSKVIIEEFYDVLIKEQLAFFNRINSSINRLEEGVSVQNNLYTKSQNKRVLSGMSITKIEKNKRFKLETTYSHGSILQTYELTENDKGKCQVKYSEKNTFNEVRNQYGFMLMGLLYSFFMTEVSRKELNT